MKFEMTEDRGICARYPVKWRFLDDANGSYTSIDEHPLFYPRKLTNKKDLNAA
jgi:hypothetical protein